MNDLYLILDCNYLARRAQFSMPKDMSYGGMPTAIPFALLKEVAALQGQFQTNKVLFCFDSKGSKRKEIYPAYKAKRYKKEMTEEELEAEKAFRYQLKKLRTEYLSTIGWRNIYWKSGFEADDLITKLCTEIASKKNKGILVTSDHDLYQLIGPRISFYNPHDRKEITLEGFRNEFGIEPLDWVIVKAIAGCSTDNVEGIKGVGEKTAIKYIRNELKETTKAYQAILKGKKIIHRNLDLVELPFNGTPDLKIKKDELSLQGWKDVIRKLGFKSLAKDFNPFPGERKHGSN